LLNTAYVLLKLFFGEGYNNLDYFDLVNKLDHNFSISDNKIEFFKFERLDYEKAKEKKKKSTGL
jgi:hypothetical protein